jgi:hypothetical protein
MSGLELQGITNYRSKELMSSALAILRDDKQELPRPDVKKTLYASTDEA